MDIVQLNHYDTGRLICIAFGEIPVIEPHLRTIILPTHFEQASTGKISPKVTTSCLAYRPDEIDKMDLIKSD